MTEKTFDVLVRERTDDFIRRWWESPAEFPDLGSPFSLQEQKRREAELQAHLDRLYVLARNPPKNPDPETQARLQALVVRIFQCALGFEERHTDAVLKYGFREAVVEFADRARQFDPQISDADIYQAARNSTSMNLMQALLGIPMKVTPSVFAYSMLYPYTDNYLDDPSISRQEKMSFNARFRRRIAGEPVAAANRREEAILGMIGIIEGQYPRDRYPVVYDSLLAIHAAQTGSLALMDRSASPYEVDVLRAVVLKGGTSALTDGYLVAGDLPPEQAKFMFDYGAFTQLMDDLEDVRPDRIAGIQTVFSQTAGRWQLDRVVNKTIHCGEDLLGGLEAFPSPELNELKEILHLSFNPILIDSAACAAPYLSRAYLQQLQANYPFRFSFIKRQRTRFRRKQASLKLLLEGLMMYALLPPKTARFA